MQLHQLKIINLNIFAGKKIFSGYEFISYPEFSVTPILDLIMDNSIQSQVFLYGSDLKETYLAGDSIYDCLINNNISEAKQEIEGSVGNSLSTVLASPLIEYKFNTDKKFTLDRWNNYEAAIEDCPCINKIVETTEFTKCRRWADAVGSMTDLLYNNTADLNKAEIKNYFSKAVNLVDDKISSIQITAERFEVLNNVVNFTFYGFSLSNKNLYFKISKYSTNDKLSDIAISIFQKINFHSLLWYEKCLNSVV